MSTHINSKRLGGGILILTLLFLITGTAAVVVDPPTSVDPPPEPPVTGVSELCAQNIRFYRQDLPPELNYFGPGAPEEVEAARAELTKRVCEDPALAVAQTWYARREYRTAEVGVGQTQTLMNDRKMWADTVAILNERWNSATNVEVVDMSGPYRTMYMSLAPIPLIYQDAVDKPTFKVLRFTYSNGSVDNLKLDCGYQPVEVDFPGLPGKVVPQAAPQVVPKAGGQPDRVHPSRPKPGPGPGPGPTPTTKQRVPVKGNDPGPPPCPGGCNNQGSAGGSPGSGGAISRGDDGYSPSDPAPTPKVAPSPPPTSKASIPATTAPPTTKVSKPAG